MKWYRKCSIQLREYGSVDYWMSKTPNEINGWIIAINDTKK